MGYMQCSTCEEPVLEIYSVLELGEPEFEEKLKVASEAHAPKCSGQKPPPKPPESLPHRYLTGQPWSERMKGPCKICHQGARYELHYQDGRYL